MATLTEAIKDVITNPSYHSKISAVSAAFRDQLNSPVDRAVFWTEYVIRHNGAPHLKSPEKDLTWVQLLHLDIILALHIVLYLTYIFVKIFFRTCFGGKKTIKKEQAKG